MKEHIPIRLTDAQRKLVEENIPLVGYVMHRHGTQGLDMSEDTFQIGVIGLIKAAARYDSSRSKFTTFAVKCVLNELRREARLQKRRQPGDVTVMSLDMPLKSDDLMTLKDIIPTDEPCTEDRVSSADLAGRLLRLLERHGTLASRITLDSYKTQDGQREVGKRHNASQATVSISIRRMTRWLRKQAAAQGEARP